MVRKVFSIGGLREMGCCSCFGFLSKPQRRVKTIRGANGQLSCEFLLPDDSDGMDEDSFNGEYMLYGTNGEVPHRSRSSEAIILDRIQRGTICREVPVKETRHVIRTEEENGNKMVNEYVRECKIGSGSYGKVVLYRSTIDGKRYAIKVFHKSHLQKLRVAPSETAMTDVLREVMIMKMLDHPNIVNLIEVIDDPETDHFYMVLEYVDGKWVCEGSGAADGIGETTARQYLRDIVSGLAYLHAHRRLQLFCYCIASLLIGGHLFSVFLEFLFVLRRCLCKGFDLWEFALGNGKFAIAWRMLLPSANIVHGDIKPDNLLVTSSGMIKIGDFSVSQVFEDNNDELRRSPGTPVFTAPECCLGLTYRGRTADVWALGVTLYCMVLGQYPFLGDTLQDTYDKIVNNPIPIPDEINPQLKNLLESLLCKDPILRIGLEDVAVHPWVVEQGPIPQYLCRCKRMNLRNAEAIFAEANGDETH